MRLLIINPASCPRELWAGVLKAQGFTIDHFRLLDEGEEALSRCRYDALFVDNRTIDGDAIGWLKHRRSSDKATRFVLVTRANDVEARIRAFENGVDDCFCDTIDTRELVVRLRALLRRGPIMHPSILNVGNLRFDVIAREVHVAGRPLTIPRRELSLLEHFILSFNRILTRDYLDMTFYGVSGDGSPNSFEVRISRLRRALVQVNADVEIKTVRGIGYRMQYREVACVKIDGPDAKAVGSC